METSGLQGCLKQTFVAAWSSVWHD